MISSPLSVSVAEALMQPNVYLAMACKIEFASGTSRIHSSIGQIMISGEIYEGVGTLGQVSSVTEENNSSPTSIQLTLTGIDPSLLAITLSEKVVGKVVTCFIVVFDETMNQLASNIIYKGKISQTALLHGESGAITYTVSNIFQDWAKGVPWRYTDESQKKLQPGDRIFRYVGQMAERSIYWGSKKDAPAFKYD